VVSAGGRRGTDIEEAVSDIEDDREVDRGVDVLPLAKFALCTWAERMPDVIRTLSANWTTRPRKPARAGGAGGAEGDDSVSATDRDDDRRELIFD
jgi:hypothetical protein